MRLLTVNGIAISQENPNVRSVKTEADKIMDKERLKSAAKECVKLKSINRVKKFELGVYTDICEWLAMFGTLFFHLFPRKTLQLLHRGQFLKNPYFQNNNTGFSKKQHIFFVFLL